MVNSVVKVHLMIEAKKKALRLRQGVGSMVLRVETKAPQREESSV